MDDVTRLSELRAGISAFNAERDWEPFHSPKNLTMALAAEAGELLEVFRWKTEEESRAVVGDPAVLAHVQSEVADVAIFLLTLCNSLGIDLSDAVIAKLKDNARRYPVDSARGNADKAPPEQSGRIMA